MSPPTIPILVYHSIAEERRGVLARWTLSPAAFADHLRYLRDHGYVGYTVTELARRLGQRLPLADKPVAITFDDAYGDFHENALPLLTTHDFVATVYVPTAFVGRATTWVSSSGPDARRVMSSAELRSIVAAGVECGAHSHTHPELDLLPGKAVRQEVPESKRRLEDLIQREVTSFAYPFGFFSARVRDAVAGAGYTCACAVGNVAATADSDRHALPRLTVEADADVTDLERLLGYSGSAAAIRQARVKQVVWRGVRRGMRLARATRSATQRRPGGRHRDARR